MADNVNYANVSTEEDKCELDTTGHFNEVNDCGNNEGDGIHADADPHLDLNARSELVHNVGSSHIELADHGTGDVNISVAEQDAIDGANGAVQVTNGKAAIAAHEMDGQGIIQEHSTGDVEGTHVSEGILPEPVWVQAKGSDAIQKSILTEVKSSICVAESQPIQSGNLEVTSSMTFAEPNQSVDREVIGSTDVSQSEAKGFGNMEITSSKSSAESESNQQGDDEIIESVNLAELHSNESGNVEIIGNANASESEQIQTGVEDNVEGESKPFMVTDRKENQDFPISVLEEVQNDNHLNRPQTTSDLEHNNENATSLVVTEVKTEGAEAVDASSSCEYTNALSAVHAQTCVAEEGVVNGFIETSQNTYEQNVCAVEDETSVSSDAEIGRNGALSVSDAETSKGFPAAIDNGAINDPTIDITAPVIQLESESINGCLTNEQGENLSVDHAEGSDSQSAVNDFTHASQITPEGNRLSEIVKPVIHDNGALKGYESNPAVPEHDAALESVVGTEDSCLVNNTEIHESIKNLDDGIDEGLSCHSLNDRVVMIKPECHPLTNDKMSSSLCHDADPEIDNNSAIESEEKVSIISKDDVDSEAAKCVSSKPVSAEYPDTEACLSNSVENQIDVKADSEVERTLAFPRDKGGAPEFDDVDGAAVTNQKAPNCILDDIYIKSRGSESVITDSGKKTPKELAITEGINRKEPSASSAEGSAIDDGQDSAVEVMRKPFYYVIRIPRYDDDENLKEQIRLAQHQVDEKTKIRDAIRAEMQRERANCNKYGSSIDAALSEETAARDLLKAKRKEIDSVLAVINRGKNASELKNIDKAIHGMEHRIQHETLPLKEEKSYILEIKKLKQARERISSNLGSQGSLENAIDQQVQSEERLKILRKEADLLRENAFKAEAATTNAEKIYEDVKAKLDELVDQFRAADDVRQEAYAHLQSLRKRLYDKNKYFYQYKDDAKAASDLASKGDREGLQCHCINQVERVMELWNNNDEFRKEYIRCNLRSTVRRFRTLDGRSLGPDEELPAIPMFVSEILTKNNVMPSISTLQEVKTIASIETQNKDDKSIANVGEQNNPIVKSKKPAKHAPLRKGPATVPSKVDIEEADVEEHKLTKEEEELARKAKELRKEVEATILREQRRLEEKAKAKEAIERKKRNADKAQARAELKAQKEAEHKEKIKEKRARKKQKRKELEEVNGGNEVESTPSFETPTETKESETIEKPVAMTKRSQKSLPFAKQTKTKSMPSQLRNRGKRRMHSWTSALLIGLIIFALFLMGNGSFSLQRFGF